MLLAKDESDENKLSCKKTPPLLPKGRGVRPCDLITIITSGGSEFVGLVRRNVSGSSGFKVSTIMTARGRDNVFLRRIL